MHRLIAILIGALLLAPAAAAELIVESGAAVLLSSEGSVVGAGEFEGGNLALELLAGFSGFATLFVVDDAGNRTSVELMVGSDASLVLTETLEDIREVVAAQGGQVTVRTEERLEAGGEMAFGAAVPDHVELPAVALEGMRKAAEHYAEARARAEAAGANGAQASAGAEARGGARGEAEAIVGRGDGAEEEAEGEADAEASAGVAIGVGIGAGR
jgi:hypothetical protein